MSTIIDFLSSILVDFVKVLGLLLESFVNGFKFFTSAMSTIPGFVVDILNSLPSFFKVGLTGVFGLLLFVVFFKLFAIIKTS